MMRGSLHRSLGLIPRLKYALMPPYFYDLDSERLIQHEDLRH